jgi:hypothetical protein
MPQQTKEETSSNSHSFSDDESYNTPKTSPSATLCRNVAAPPTAATEQVITQQPVANRGEYKYCGGKK